ncbi:MAG: hypothetical protein RLZZ297_482 [Chloroflexota bacterium]
MDYDTTSPASPRAWATLTPPMTSHGVAPVHTSALELATPAAIARFAATSASSRQGVLEYIHAMCRMVSLCVYLPYVLDPRQPLRSFEAFGSDGTTGFIHGAYWMTRRPTHTIAPEHACHTIESFISACIAVGGLPRRGTWFVWSEAVVKHIAAALAYGDAPAALPPIADRLACVGIVFRKPARRIIVTAAETSGAVVIPRVCCVLAQHAGPESCPMCPQRPRSTQLAETATWIESLDRYGQRGVSTSADLDAACTRTELPHDHT